MNLYNLHYDYTNTNGRSLIFFINPEVEADNLSELQVKMLQVNNISRILPLEIEEIDFNVRLRFNLSGKKALKYSMDEMSINQYFQLLLNIAMTIKDSKLYMLNENNYILNSEFIFIGVNINDIYLTYLPLKELSSKANFREELMNLATELITFVNRIEGNEFQELIGFMKKESFHISDLIDRLLSIINKLNNNQNEQLSNYNISEFNSNIRNNKATESKPKVVELNKSAMAINKRINPLTERQKVVLYSSTFVLIAIVWKLYLQYSSEGFFYISLGLTLFAIDIALVLTKIWRPSLIKRKEQAEAKVSFKTKNNNVKDSRVKVQLTNANNFYKNIGGNTTLLNQNETVSLQVDEGSIEVNKAYLEIKRNNEKEKILIENDSFIIGRGSKVDYIENARGISRMHFEIARIESGYAIKDLFSKNGTYLNDKQIVSNKFYQLKSRDVIAIGNLNFTFFDS